MRDSTVKSSRLSLFKGSLLLLCMLLSLVSQQAFALIQNNLACTATGTTGIIQLGDLAPSTNYTANMTANCRVTRWYPYGASLQHSQFYNSGRGSKVQVFHTNSGLMVPELPIGTASSTCMPSSCVQLFVGDTFSYNVRLLGTAPVTPGDYKVSVSLTDTSIRGFENYADYLQTVILSFRVIQPACSMGSAKTLNLPFGTLSSNDFASSQQIANVTMNCTRGTQATATLVPTQPAISGSPGVSATTLAGLSMAATWADNNTAVTFNSPRTLPLTTGTNTIRLGFRPRLNTSVSPTGNFSSQYTLNITYL
ncbi:MULTISPECIES: fimbrial protein [unclassified Pseudomonas]|uniref:fimbrial protein n=1 Tax=unclassified Pseudomonas TaxID=196821 RepID=UPI001C5B7C68|nr:MULTISPECIES: fimbrial protein [unclassified Pseudomonas]MBW3504433.1 fimbrial protein [Pseudomonas sp. NKUCC02_KPG]MEC4241143.1 fimbrial protein [Pseudomonas sp. DSV-1]